MTRTYVVLFVFTMLLTIVVAVRLEPIKQHVGQQS
jgi:hypothetical protein